MRHFVLLMALASCTNPDDIFPVRGLLASTDPVEGQLVRLLRHVQPVIPGDYARCLPSSATPFRETEADAEGKYSFDLFRVEAQSLVGYDQYCFRVAAIFASGSTASSDFESIRFETAVALLRDWRAEPRLENAVLIFEPPVPLPDEFVTTPDLSPKLVTQLNHRAQVVTDDGGVIWQVDDRFWDRSGSLHFREPMVLDGVRLEDFAGAVVLRAHLLEVNLVPSGFDEALPPPIDLVSGRTLAVRGTRTPVSRGLPCPPFATPCPLTDGDLTPVDGLSVQDVTLTLSAPGSLSAIVLRGLEAGDSNVGVRLALPDGGVATSSGYVPTNSAFGENSSAASQLLPDGGFGPRRPLYLVIPVDAGTVLGLSLRFPEGLSVIQEISLFE